MTLCAARELSSRSAQRSKRGIVSQIFDHGAGAPDRGAVASKVPRTGRKARAQRDMVEIDRELTSPGDGRAGA